MDWTGWEHRTSPTEKRSVSVSCITTRPTSIILIMAGRVQADALRSGDFWGRALLATLQGRRAGMAAALLIGVFACVSAAGCRECEGPLSQEDGGESIAAQVAAVRAGRSTRIAAAAPLTVAEWASLEGVPGLRELVLDRGRADDAAATIIATNPGLERLVLRDSPLTDVGMGRLGSCRALRDLNVPQAACTAAGVRNLAGLEGLRSLRLGGPLLGGPEVCEAVVGLPHLRSLHLIDVPIGDSGLAVLQRLPGLWNLYLDGAGVSDDAWIEYFRACPNVHVHIDQAHHDRDPRRHD